MSAESILIIFDGADDAVCRAGELMINHGARVQWLPDVYAAMAQLATGDLPNRLLVDARCLDEQELSFLNLAPRFYPAMRVTVLLLDGATSRLDGAPGRYDSATLEEISDDVLGIRPAMVAEAETEDEAEVVEWGGGEETTDDSFADREPQAPSTPQPDEMGEVADPGSSIWDALPAESDAAFVDPDSLPMMRQAGGRLSTDGDAESLDEDAPSLHEAVRRRMGGADLSAQRRSPPPRIPPARVPPPGPVEPIPEARDSAISPEELDALLHDEADETSDEGGAA